LRAPFGLPYRNPASAGRIRLSRFFFVMHTQMAGKSQLSARYQL
jgi:hypothetical protein